MAPFRTVIAMEVRLEREEVERRLLRVVRKPRTLVELLRRMPVNPPEHPEFVGVVGNGRFALGRLGDIASAVGRFQSLRPTFRGTITKSDKGSAIRITFIDVFLTVFLVGMALAIGLMLVVATLSGTIRRPENLLIILVFLVGVWGYRYSNRTEVEASVALIRSTLERSSPRTDGNLEGPQP